MLVYATKDSMFNESSHIKNINMSIKIRRPEDFTKLKYKISGCLNKTKVPLIGCSLANDVNGSNNEVNRTFHTAFYKILNVIYNICDRTYYIFIYLFSSCCYCCFRKTATTDIVATVGLLCVGLPGFL